MLPGHENWQVIAGAVGGLVISLLPFVLLWFLDRVLGGTPTGNIMLATTKEAIRQPVFILLLAIVLLANVVFSILPYFTLGDDTKVLMDCGLMDLLVASLFLAVWTASTSVAEEIEGKTAMTLLSKPVNRRQFILGKYLGILGAVVLLLIPITVGFLGCIYCKVPYDSWESGLKENYLPRDSMDAVMQVLPGVLLVFFESAVMAAVSVAISTRLPMVVNMVTCLAIFVIGHLTPTMVQANVFKLELVQFMARLIATVLPALEVFNISAAVATGSRVPANYLGWSALYCASYAAMAILLAFILFEDRDLA